MKPRWIPAAALLLLSACRFQPNPKEADGRRIFRVGYLTNITHAPALAGLETGAFQRALGRDVSVKALGFAAGPSLVEALFAGELDVAYVGPNPAINGFQRSHGLALKVVAGSTSGGAQFIVSPEITEVAQLRGKRVASPALGNTQDVALRSYLAEQQLSFTGSKPEVEVLTLAPADILTLFRRGQVAGAWVPEPWASRLVQEGNGHVLVDEKDRWPKGVFPTTVVVASSVAMERRPDLVARFLRAHEESVRQLAAGSHQAQAAAAARLARELGKPLPARVLERAFSLLSFTTDPFEAQLTKLAFDAHRLGFIQTDSVAGLVDRSLAPERNRVEVALP